MPSVTKNSPPGAVAEQPAGPYTGPVSAETAAAAVPWWKDAVRSWAPVLGFAVLLVFQMVSLQQQIGELRTDLHREIGDLRTDVQKEIGGLRTDVQKEIGGLRTDVQKEIGDLRTDVQQGIGDLRTDVQQEIGGLRDDLRTDIGALGERIARLEALIERAGAASRPGG